MISNLLYYGIALGLGFLFSFYFWESTKRSAWLTLAALLVPFAWTLVLARLDVDTLDSLSALADLYNIETNYARYSGRSVAALGIVPMLWSFFLFGVIWIERRLYLDRKEAAPQR